jgi:signal transduction histidine kinase
MTRRPHRLRSRSLQRTDHPTWWRGEEEDPHHLSGVGLWFVEWTIRHSGGEFTVEDTEHAGATVVIHVPKAPEMLSSSLSSLLK